MSSPQNLPPRSHGCLFGCLAVLAFLFLPVILAGFYGAWFLWQGFHRDPVLRVVGELVRKDGMAHQMLGDDIHITGMEGNVFSFVPGLGSRTDYEVDLSGTRANGTLDVEADDRHGQVQVKSMVLSLPDGGRYDLLHHLVLTPGNNATSI